MKFIDINCFRSVLFNKRKRIHVFPLRNFMSSSEIIAALLGLINAALIVRRSV